MSMTREAAEDATILRATVGSGLHGLAIPGKDDHDEMGVLLEPFRYAAGLDTFEQYIYRTAAEREGRHDAPSQAGDLDLTLYSLKKYVRLCLNGNPTVLCLLYAPDDVTVTKTAAGAALRRLAPAFVSRKAGVAFLGYLTAQKQKLLHERGGNKVRRPELEAKHGFDTKFAMHMLRLGYQGVEYLETGQITLPMPPEARAFCYATRLGEVSLNDVLTKTGELEVRLKDLAETSPWPAEANREAAQAFLEDTYFEWWTGTSY
jgi:predicted nucleotidyltransferase